jgi:hypothetical protein
MNHSSWAHMSSVNGEILIRFTINPMLLVCSMEGKEKGSGKLGSYGPIHNQIKGLCTPGASKQEV